MFLLVTKVLHFNVDSAITGTYFDLIKQTYKQNL